MVVLQYSSLINITEGMGKVGVYIYGTVPVRWFNIVIGISEAVFSYGSLLQ